MSDAYDHFGNTTGTYTFNHKDGCLVKDFHRVPIDCVTEKDLHGIIDQLRAEKRELSRQIIRLKVELYDAIHRDDDGEDDDGE